MELDLKDIFKILRKRMWLTIAVVFIASAGAGLFSKFYIDPVYEASTKLIVNQSQDAQLVPSLDLNQVNLNLRLIDTYKEIIRTPAIMNVVAERHPEFGLSAGQLIRKVQVSSVNNTQVMTLIVEDGSYRKAAEIVNTISLVFKEEIPTIMNVDNVSILNEADLEATPASVRPNVSLNVAVAFVVSLMAVIGWAFLMEYLDDTVKSENDIASFLELPTLTVVAKTEADDFLSHAAKSSKRRGGSNSAVTNKL